MQWTRWSAIRRATVASDSSRPHVRTPWCAWCEGLYPFVSHAFAHVDLGQVGLLKVGNPKGHMSH